MIKITINDKSNFFICNYLIIIIKNSNISTNHYLNNYINYYIRKIYDLNYFINARSKLFKNLFILNINYFSNFFFI